MRVTETHGLSSQKMSNHQKGVAMSAAGSMAGAPSGLLVRLLQHVGAWTILLWRTVPYLVTMLIAWGAIGPRARAIVVSELKWNCWGAAAIFFLAAQSVALVVAVLLTTVANVAAIQQLASVFCALGDKLAGDVLPTRTVVMIIVGLCGIAVIFAGNVELGSSISGLLVALCNPISWAFYWQILRHQNYAEEVADAVTTATINRTTIGVIETGTPVHGVFVLPEPENEAGIHPSLLRCAKSIPYLTAAGILCGITGGAVGTDQHVSTMSSTDWLWYFLFGGVCLPMAQLLFTIAPAFISSAEIACVKMIEVILAPVLVYLYDGEEPTWNTYVGGALIAVAVLGHSIATIYAGG